MSLFDFRINTFYQNIILTIAIKFISSHGIVTPPSTDIV
uniref:Uncharacterized protein n=1 Tax=uncultured Desulfobacterium sp. TaxID=201089 RepID=E1YAK4_9BACT|nr:unknown protein [uncultured Desulfobacterium sp.]